MRTKHTAALAILFGAIITQGIFADLFYSPTEYRNQYDDSYALKLELDRLKTGTDERNQRNTASLTRANDDIENYKAMLAERNRKLTGLELQAKELENRLQKEIAAGNLRIKRRGDKIVINMDDKILFSSGSATVKPEIFDTLANISDILAKNRNIVMVEGHTDDIPIHTPAYRDNWQLSSERAAAVLRTILRKKSLNPSRFSAAGFAEFQPVVPNNSDASRQLNSRVDLVISPES